MPLRPPAPFCLALALALLPCAAPAQNARTLKGLDAAPDWTLDTPKPSPRRGKPAAAAAGPASAEEAERAARLAEGRRKFFENKPEGPARPKDFGGYDYKRDSGTMAPGATFRF